MGQSGMEANFWMGVGISVILNIWILALGSLKVVLAYI